MKELVRRRRGGWRRDDVRVGLLILVVCLAGCTDVREPLNGPDLIVLHGALVIDGTERPPFKGAVVIQGERILRVADAGQFDYGPDVDVRDVEGLWIIPGLIDAHAHADEQALRTFLTFGVTGLRDPAGPIENHDLASRLASGEVMGPHLLAGGPLIDLGSGRPQSNRVLIESEAELREEVRRQTTEGVKLVKLYRRLPPAYVAAGIEEAHRAGASVIGHLRSTDWQQAAAFGIDELTHWLIYGALEEFLPSPVRDSLSEGARDMGWCSSDLMTLWLNEVDLDGPEVAEFVAALAREGVVVSPTLVLEEAVLWGDDLMVRERLHPELAPQVYSSEEWWGFPHSYSASCASPALRDGKEAFNRSLQILGMLHRNGVPILAGSDYPNAWMTPGVALHRELQLLVKAGLTELEALRTATIIPAVEFGWDQEMGSVQEGRLANLVILRADPLEDISNTLEIVTVVHRGVFLDPPAMSADAGG
jgi:hypothetical protein